jgi:hypothetical protein
MRRAKLLPLRMLILSSLLLLLPGIGTAIQAPIPTERLTMTAVAVAGEVVIDGRLDDSDWARAPVAAGFVQQRPEPGAPETERTEVRVLYDSRNLYVGMRMYDSSPDSIAAQLGRRDATDLHADRAHVMIDSYLDRRTAFRFAVNAAGVKLDVMQFDDIREDISWNAVWDVATQIDSLGWTAEFRIPFSQLRFIPPESGDIVWGINFARDIARRNERTYWAPTEPGANRFVSLFGDLYGLRISRAPTRLELLPYTAARMDRAPAHPDDPFHSGAAGGVDAGLDVMYGLGPNLTLSATINPDFGQVEVDPAVVNLSAFETFFPERRPFFLERADIFNFDLNIGDGGSETLFYSRRIGRAPRGGVPEDAVFSDIPSGSRILGAAKVTGRVNGWSVGFLDAVSDGVTARYSDPAGNQHSRLVEPLTNYAVARLSRNFRGGTSGVGMMATAVNRDLSADHLSFLPSAAYAIGVDARHRFWKDEWEVNATYSGSLVQGSENAIARLQRSPARYYQRPDADHLTYDPTRTSLSGSTARLQVARVAGSWRGGTILYTRTPGFEVNDLGFQQEADLVIGGVYAGRLQFQPGKVLRTWNLFTNVFTGWTYGGELGYQGYNVNGGFELLNGWGGGGGTETSPRTLSTSALRGGPALLQSPRTNFWANLYTDRRLPLRFSAGTNGQIKYETGGGRLSLNTTATFRPSSWLSASLGPSVTWNRDHTQYVGTVRPQNADPIYLHGRLDQTTVSLNTRLNVTFTPDLTLELFAQPFVSAGEYSEFKQVADPRARRFEDRFVAYTGAVPDPSFNFRSLRGNAVLRWEYRPGSALFLVWQQRRSAVDPHGDFDLGRDFFGALREPGEHVFLAKLTYWLGR